MSLEEREIYSKFKYFILLFYSWKEDKDETVYLVFIFMGNL